MNHLFSIANEYLQQSDWKDLAMIKFCLFAVGVLIGLFVPTKAKKAALMTAICVFVVTYLPLMTKLFRIISGKHPHYYEG